ncbi:hypothetical protein ACVR0O_05820 [Streptococcus caviae]|nr:hypothetical protein [Streptococcus sp. 'caviae']
MSFLTAIIDDYLAESDVSLAYFDKEGCSGGKICGHLSEKLGGL